MNINHEHKTCFIRIPKNAGASIQKLYGISCPDTIGQVITTRGEWIKDYNIFAVIRNPFERLISGFESEIDDDIDFIEWVESKQFLRYEWARPQTIWTHFGSWRIPNLFKMEDRHFRRVVIDYGNSIGYPMKGTLDGKRTTRKYRKYYSSRARIVVEKNFYEDFLHYNYTW